MVIPPVVAFTVRALTCRVATLAGTLACMLRTDRDSELLHALAFKVRMLSLDQIASAWWRESSDPRRFARRRLGPLCQAGLLEEREVLAHPLLELRAPVFTWTPGATAPDPEAISYELKTRWTQPPRRTPVFIATKRTLAELGGAGGKLPILGQETHDLHMGSVYLRRLRERPAEAEAWVGEDVFAPQRRGQKLPDAVLLDSSGQVTLVIEFAGSYGSERVARFHEDCAEREVPYELW